MHNLEKDLIHSVQNAFQLIRSLAAQPHQGPAELAASLGLNRSSVYRLLWTLESVRAVVPLRGGTEYGLGPLLANLAPQAWEHMVNELCLPPLIRLRKATLETASLYLARSSEIVCSEIVEGPYEVRRTMRRGDAFSLPRGATAKCYLAWRVTEVPMPKLFLSSLGVLPEAADGWLSTFCDIRTKQYAVSWQERVPGGCAIAAPVFDRNGRLRACVTLSGPTSRITPDDLSRYVDAVRTTASQLQELLITYSGGPGDDPYDDNGAGGAGQDPRPTMSRSKTSHAAN